MSHCSRLIGWLMYGFDASASAGSGSASSVVWKSAMRFCVSSRMRFSPRMGYSRGDGGRTELHAGEGGQCVDGNGRRETCL